MSRSNPHILAPALKVVFCGINPPAEAGRSGHNFSTPSNRFWTVLHLSGFTAERLRPHAERRLLEYNCGVTAVVLRATRRAIDVPREEFREARPEFEERMRRFAPDTLAFLGKRAYAAMIDLANVPWGRQRTKIADIPTWVLPNPSGLNRSFTLDALVAAYSEFRVSLDAERNRVPDPCKR